MADRGLITLTATEASAEIAKGALDSYTFAAQPGEGVEVVAGDPPEDAREAAEDLVVGVGGGGIYVFDTSAFSSTSAASPATSPSRGGL